MDNGLVVFISGYGTGSVGQSVGNDPESSGLGILANQAFINDMQFQKGVFGWDEQDRILDHIREFRENNPDAPIYMVGHSFGADSAVEVAEQLKTEDVWLDKLVMIDSVGVNDDKVPENVLEALNIYSTSGDGIDGEYPVGGADNLGIDDSSHTAIDNDPRSWEAIQNFFGSSVTDQINDLNEVDDPFSEFEELLNEDAIENQNAWQQSEDTDFDDDIIDFDDNPDEDIEVFETETFDSVEPVADLFNSFDSLENDWGDNDVDAYDTFDADDN